MALAPSAIIDQLSIYIRRLSDILSNFDKLNPDFRQEQIKSTNAPSDLIILIWELSNGSYLLKKFFHQMVFEWYAQA